MSEAPAIAVRVFGPGDLIPEDRGVEVRMVAVPRIGDTVILDTHDSRVPLTVTHVSWVVCICELCRKTPCVPRITLAPANASQ